MGSLKPIDRLIPGVKARRLETEGCSFNPYERRTEVEGPSCNPYERRCEVEGCVPENSEVAGWSLQSAGP